MDTDQAHQLAISIGISVSEVVGATVFLSEEIEQALAGQIAEIIMPYLLDYPPRLGKKPRSDRIDLI